MEGPDRTDVDADVVPPVAARLVVLAEALAEVWATASAEIRAIEDSRCWGSDEPGRAFELSYLGPAGETSVPQITADNATAIIARLRELGGAIGSSAILSRLSDEESAANLQRLADAGTQ